LFGATCLLIALSALAQSPPLATIPGLRAANRDVSRPDTLVVCAPAFTQTMERWVAYRQGQGHQVVVRSDCETAAEVRAAVRQVAAAGTLKHVLLVGDVQDAPDETSKHLPTYLARAEVNIAWGSESELATDNWFADVDDDVIPDVAIGRWPVDTSLQLSMLIEKTIAYEQQASHGIWRRRVNLVAGVGGFGVLADAVLETATRSFIQQGIPESYRTSMTYASWRSPYCPDPRRFRSEVIQRMNEGCLCWVYIGHGQRTELDWVRVPIGVAPIFESADVQRLKCTQGPPIAVFLSCYGAAFDGAEDCLSEQMLMHATGPVAVIGGSRMTMPYGMAVLSQSLMHEMFERRPETLGEVLLAAKKQAMAGAEDGVQRPLLDTLARVMTPGSTNLEAERREHVLMFHLLGDPLLRLTHPRSVQLQVPQRVKAGESLTVQWQSELAGRCVLELACRRGQLPFRPEPRLHFDGSDAGMQMLSQVYRQANDDTFARRQFVMDQTTGEALLPVPEHVRGACAVRLYLESDQGHAIAAATVFVTHGDEARAVGAEGAEESQDEVLLEEAALPRE
jgi:hypothetical protein